MLLHCLIDASALVPFFLEIKTPGPDLLAKLAIAKLLDLRAEGRASLYLPNFCMAECSKVLAKIAYSSARDYDKATRVYKNRVDHLLDAVSSSRKGLIRSLELQRPHLVDVEDIFTTEHRLFPHEKHNLLSGLDALLISMGRQLAKTHGSENVLIVTCEDRMTRVCNNNRSQFPRAINVTKQPIPG